MIPVSTVPGPASGETAEAVVDPVFCKKPPPTVVSETGNIPAHTKARLSAGAIEAVILEDLPLHPLKPDRTVRPVRKLSPETYVPALSGWESVSYKSPSMHQANWGCHGTQTTILLHPILDLP